MVRRLLDNLRNSAKEGRCREAGDAGDDRVRIVYKDVADAAPDVGV